MIRNGKKVCWIRELRGRRLVLITGIHVLRLETVGEEVNVRREGAWQLS